MRAGLSSKQRAAAMNSVSEGRRRLSQVLLLAPAAPQVAHAQANGTTARGKTLRYAFRVASLKRFFDPRLKSPRLYLLENAGILGMNELRRAALAGGHFDYDREVEGLRVLDRYTFQVKLAEPAPHFYFHFADNSFTGAVAREVIEAHDEQEIMGVPVGTGPFRLAQWKRSSFMRDFWKYVDIDAASAGSTA